MGPPQSSTSPSPDSLVGIDPDHTEEVAYGPAVVVVGPTSAGAWERIRLGTLLATQDAHRRAIRKLAAEGLEPEAVVRTNPNGSVLTALDAELRLDPLLSAQIRDAMLEAARFSVRGHTGFAFADGTPRPFSVTREKIRGRSIDVVGDETMRFYEANPQLVDLIWRRLVVLNTFGEPEKKASPR